MVDIITRYYDKNIILRRSVDISSPVKLASKTALFYIHGGGWARGAKDQFHYHHEYFTSKGFLCASLGYRLVPEVRIYEQIADIIDGYDCCISYIKENKLDINKIIIIGGSAGAHLASMVALNPPEKYMEENSLKNTWITPAACVSIHGPASLVEWPTMNPHIRKCIEDLADTTYGENGEIFYDISPITYVNKDSPPFLFLLAEKEEFFLNEEILQMSAKLKEHYIYSRVEIFENVKHGFFYTLEGKRQKDALMIMEDFISIISDSQTK